jgi:hypothetical protein
MKTKQLDLEIERLKMLKNRNELTETGLELLSELIDVKKQLTLTDVGNTLNGRKYIDLEKVNKGLNDINLKPKDAYLETEKGKCKLVVELESIIK